MSGGMKDEFIEREAAISELQRWSITADRPRTWMNAIDKAIEVVKAIPAADVRPVVFCKDCVYSDNWYADRLMCYLWNEHDGNSVFEDGFCNYGEKREGE